MDYKGASGDNDDSLPSDSEPEIIHFFLVAVSHQPSPDVLAAYALAERDRKCGLSGAEFDHYWLQATKISLDTVQEKN
jgi:hypothetical protein